MEADGPTAGRGIIDPMVPNADTIHDSVWSKLEAGGSNRRSPFHTPVLGTVGLDGLAQVRTVVLRRVDRSTRMICCHTDRRSPKVREIMAADTVSWLFYDPSDGIQVRARGTCRVHTGSEDPLACETWRGVRPHSRVCYHAPHPPSVELAHWEGNQPPQAHAISNTTPGTDDLPPDTFAVLATRIDCIEWLDLHHDGHHRIRFDYDGKGTPVSTWLAP